VNKKPNEITRFIKTDLAEKLDSDFQGPPFRIFRERDLHACCYFHLRRFIGRDPWWEICNEPYLKGLKGRDRGAQPDVVLFYRSKAVALIELKFRRRGIGIQRKDQRVLRRAVKKGKTNKRWVKKAFYVEVAVRPRGSRPRKVTKYRNRVISLQMNQEGLADYLQIYRHRRKPERPRRGAA
jgi:hypothetical protein